MSFSMRVAKFPPLPGFGLDMHKIGPGSVVPPLPVPPVPTAPWLALLVHYPSLCLSGKFTTQTLTDGMLDTITGNDWGTMQPHIPIPPILASNIVPVMIGASHKHFLPAYSVMETANGGLLVAAQAPDDPIAVCTPVCMIALQHCSDPVSLPCGIQFHLPTTRWVGMSLCDLLAAAISMVGDNLTDKMSDRMYGKLIPETLGGAIIGAALSAVVDFVAESMDATEGTGAAGAVVATLGCVIGPPAAAVLFGKAADAVGEMG
ncbi:hypothetical protein [Diaphorobacter aerolatus]|uniref:Uncharacterized protein n=1 Tax=Diaphorobacter aerolatus TaxID=1288495 RepID=A0A7H0GLJ2_9BURK|nr:hypothetical protein [Diaphorobacter aerolatus]QNP49158.1 hypothetical protein H9K75_03255 [Diaphorobacter aerolatus]